MPTMIPELDPLSCVDTRSPRPRHADPSGAQQQRSPQSLAHAAASRDVEVPVQIDGYRGSAVLQQANGGVVRKHERLRTCLKDLEGTPVQYVKPLTHEA